MSHQQRPWLGLWILTLACFATITTEVVPIGLVPAIVQSFGVDEAQAGMLVTLYAMIVALTAVPLTRITSHVQRKTLVLVTLAIFTASNTLAALAPDFLTLAIARGIAGIAHALFCAVALGYAARIAPPGLTGRALALVATGTSAGLIVGVPAGAVVATAFGWRAAFGALAAIGAIAILAAAPLLPAVRHDRAAAKSVVPGGARMLLVAGLAGAAFLGYYTLYTYVSPLLLSSGLPGIWLGAMLAALGVTGLLAIQLAARYIDRAPMRWLMFVPLTITAMQLLVSLVYPLLLPILIITALWTASFGPVNTTYQNALVRVGAANPDMAGAWINVTCNLGIAGGAALGGALVVGPGYPAAGFAGAAILAASTLVTFLFRRSLAAGFTR
ncbi:MULTISPECIES: MFS transporter [Microbacterium]|uniref:MFS transporter n=1 Tax=Microbacterium TaxID=33882 RepID=UPI001E53A0FA|nr:MFS transporter [Microbacterium nymphoidis]MCD2497622.1 MFS transporter [Microbacterium nymphoidis]